MINLLRGDISRSFRSRPFMICVMLVFFITLWSSFDTMLQRSVYEQLEEIRPPYLYIETLGHIGKLSLIAGLCTVFLAGCDFDGGNIKNKLLAGHSKAKIYLSSLITSFIFGIFLLLLQYLVTTLAFWIGFGWSYISRIFVNDWSTMLFVKSLIQGVVIIFYMTCLGCMFIMTLNRKLIAMVLFVTVFAFASYFGGDAAVFARATNKTVSMRNLISNETGIELDYDLLEQANPGEKCFFEVNSKGTWFVLVMNNQYYLEPDNPSRIMVTILDSINAPYRAEDPLECPTAQSMYEEGTVIFWERYLIGESIASLFFCALGYTVFKNRNLK